MFHIATPAHASFQGMPHQMPMSMPMPMSPAVQLPRTLTRPEFVEISREAILAVAPELALVPPEYIRRGLRAKAPQMYAGNASLSSAYLPGSMPKSHVPASLNIPIRGGPPAPSAALMGQPTYPTHILAVASSRSTSSDHVLLFPIHSVVLAAHCTSLPRLPPSSVGSTPSTTLHIPVLPLSLPSPTAFKILHSFLYNHSIELFLKSLFPYPSSFVRNISSHTVQATLTSGTSLHQLSMYLCASAGSSLQSLMVHAQHVNEIWQDMVALGLHDPELWDIVDLSWEVILGALNLAAAGH